MRGAPSFSRFYRQPPSETACQLNPRVLKNSCAFASSPATGVWRDARTRQTGLPNGGTVGVNNRFTVVDKNAAWLFTQNVNTRVRFTSRPAYDVFGDITMIAKFRLTSLVGGAAFVVRGPFSPGDGTTNTPFYLAANTTGEVIFRRANATAFREWTGPVLSVDTEYVVALRQIGGMENAPTIAINGQLSAMTNTAGSGTGAPTGGNLELWLGSGHGGAQKTEGVISLGAVYATAAPDLELLKFCRDPWRVFQPTPLSYLAEEIAVSGFNPAWAAGSNRYIGSGIHAA
jgi:hypothetical protein